MRVATTVALLTMVSMFSLVGCSPDIEEDGSIVAETMVTEEQAPSSEWPDWVPHWMDGTIIVRTGVYETGEDIVDTLWNRENFHAYSVSLRMRIIDMPMSKIPGETEITVLTLREAGMTGTPTIEKIRSHFGAEGYRPLTLEEAVMIRLDFTDQPGKTETANKKMSRFFALLSQEDGMFMGWEKSEWTLIIGRYLGLDFVGEGYQISREKIVDRNFSLDTAFACAKILP